MLGLLARRAAAAAAAAATGATQAAAACEAMQESSPPAGAVAGVAAAVAFAPALPAGGLQSQTATLHTPVVSHIALGYSERAGGRALGVWVAIGEPGGARTGEGW